MSAVEAEKKVEVEQAVKGGELLFCGTTCWDAIGRRKLSPEGNLVSPTRLRPLVGVDICFVAAGCGKFTCISLILTLKSVESFSSFFTEYTLTSIIFFEIRNAISLIRSNFPFSSVVYEFWTFKINICFVDFVYSILSLCGIGC